jgi:peptidoglycan glycosyltransferase
VNTPIRKVAITLGVLLLALFANLNFIQVVKGSELRNHEGNRRVLLAEYASPRGQIVVEGNAIASSRKTDDELKYLRVYEDGPMWSPVTGYYSFTFGTSGIEAAEDKVLSGNDSRLWGTQVTGVLTGRDPKGGSVELTLSMDAQQAAFKAMSNAGARGAVVALDPTTGAILAAVSTPSWDPNKLASHNPTTISDYWDSLDPQNNKTSPLINRAFSQTYPAGSTFKIITSAAAIKAGITPDQVIAAPQYYWPNGGGKGPCPANDEGPCVHNDSNTECRPGAATATLLYAFANSCNTAFAELTVEKLDAQQLADEAKQFGLDGEQLEVPLTVATSTVGPLDLLNKDAVALAQTAFGQRNVRVTPLQIAMLSATVANDGVLYKPYLVKRELGPDLSELEVTRPTLLNQVLDAGQAAELQTLMRRVITGAEGTGAAANITDQPGVAVYGKTGTADTGTTSASGAEPDRWFTGYATRDDVPKIAVAVVIENSSDLKTGGVVQDQHQSATQIARAVMSAYMQSPGGH